MPPVRPRPAWLVSPGRWSGLGRGRARGALGGLAVLMVAALALSPHDPGADPVDGSPGLALVDAVRHGGDFYAVLADMVRGSGVAASAWTMPLPTLFLIVGRAPLWLASAVMMMLAVAVVVAWYARSGGILMTRAARIVAVLLMLAGMAVALRLPLVAVPEGWAGLLVALSLARWTPDRPVEAAALGLAAATLSPAALPYAALMTLAAARDRAWRESLTWGAVLAVGVTIVLLHGQALALALPADGAEGATRAPTLAAALAAPVAATGLRLLPVAFAPLLTVMAVVGWASRREAVGVRVALLIAAETGVAAFGLPAAALIAAPLLPLGLIALPDAIRGLAGAALDRRRITVTRVTQGGVVR